MPVEAPPAVAVPGPEPVAAVAPSGPAVTGIKDNNYSRPSGQNVGNFITDKPSSRVLAPPGSLLLEPFLHVSVHNISCAPRVCKFPSPVVANSYILMAGVVFVKYVLLCRWWVSTEAWVTCQSTCASESSSCGLLVIAPYV